MTKQATTTVVVDPDRIQHLDPTVLLVDVNVRLSTHADQELVASIKEHGVLQPVTAVRTDDGQARVQLGHRRTLASIEAERTTVPVRVVADESTVTADQIQRVLRQMEENDRRAGLTSADTAHAVKQLAAFGLTVAQIAKRTRRPREEITAALAVAASTTATEAAQQRPGLDLTQAAVLAEFEDEPETVADLLEAIENDEFDHATQRARDRRERRTRRVEITRELQQAGTRVLDDEEDARDAFVSLAHLTDTTKAEITPEQHTGCPGHVAVLEERWVWHEEQSRSRYRVVATYGCLDPDGHGHLHRYRASAPSKPRTEQEEAAAKEAAKQERRDVRESNRKWRSAETVRREFLRRLLARKTAPKGTTPFLAVAQAHDADVLADTKGSVLAAILFDIPAPGYGRNPEVAAVIEQAPATRVQLLHLVLTLAAYEALTDVCDWRNRRAFTGRYLTFLEQIGYKLSPVEERALGRREDSGDDTE